MTNTKKRRGSHKAKDTKPQEKSVPNLGLARLRYALLEKVASKIHWPCIALMVYWLPAITTPMAGKNTNVIVSAALNIVTGEDTGEWIVRGLLLASLGVIGWQRYAHKKATKGKDEYAKKLESEGDAQRSSSGLAPGGGERQLKPVAATEESSGVFADVEVVSS